MPLGSLYERFLAQQAAEQTYADGASRGARESGVRRWFRPDENGWNGDPLDPAGVAEPFSRSAVAEAYQDTFIEPEGTAGDCVALKLQSDYLACQEMAYRLRHLTPVRAAAHASARLRGHADAAVGVFARLSAHLQDVLIEASNGLPPGGYP